MTDFTDDVGRGPDFSELGSMPRGPVVDEVWQIGVLEVMLPHPLTEQPVPHVAAMCASTRGGLYMTDLTLAEMVRDEVLLEVLHGFAARPLSEGAEPIGYVPPVVEISSIETFPGAAAKFLERGLQELGIELRRAPALSVLDEARSMMGTYLQERTGDGDEFDQMTRLATDSAVIDLLETPGLEIEQLRAFVDTACALIDTRGAVGASPEIYRFDATDGALDDALSFVVVGIMEGEVPVIIYLAGEVVMLEFARRLDAAHGNLALALGESICAGTAHVVFSFEALAECSTALQDLWDERDLGATRCGTVPVPLIDRRPEVDEHPLPSSRVVDVTRTLGALKQFLDAETSGAPPAASDQAGAAITVQRVTSDDIECAAATHGEPQITRRRWASWEELPLMTFTARRDAERWARLAEAIATYLASDSAQRADELDFAEEVIIWSPHPHPRSADLRHVVWCPDNGVLPLVGFARTHELLLDLVLAAGAGSGATYGPIAPTEHVAWGLYVVSRDVLPELECALWPDSGAIGDVDFNDFIPVVVGVHADGTLERPTAQQMPYFEAILRAIADPRFATEAGGPIEVTTAIGRKTIEFTGAGYRRNESAME